jgi:hypothetical protein
MLEGLVFISNEQRCVVESRLKGGYSMLGKTASVINGLTAFVVGKGRHTIIVNSLGYNEYAGGSIVLEDV